FHMSINGLWIREEYLLQLFPEGTVEGYRKEEKEKRSIHRSQRDPLINDEEASSRVFVEVIPTNLKVIFAALYGIYYNDTEYNYLQHLKPIGVNNGGGSSKINLIKNKKDRKVKIVLPEEVLPSKDEIPFDQLDFSSFPEGFQPDMDPRLRETLEALEDDEYVEDDIDDYFEKLNNKEKDDDDENDKRSRTTGYSLTSSIMFRNEKLRLLDDQFEKVEKEYIDKLIEIESEQSIKSRQPWDCESILTARSKNESKEEKKKRKEDIKKERKKSLKQAFTKERTKQTKISENFQKNFVGAIHLE
ncbi:6831_t:CDS:10, partial [Diversispora eburnea]